MNKFHYALIGATLALGAFPALTSCSNDTDDLENRITVLEGLYKDMQGTLANAITSGYSVMSATQAANGTWTIVLSNGESIQITPGTSGGGGGADVKVEETATAIIITINGTEYALPKGGAGVQMIYAPEYEDGKVMLGTQGASVNFLVNTSIDLNATTFDIAEAHALKSRFGSDLFEVTGAELNGDILTISLRGLGCEAGSKYTVSIVANMGGSAAISNYFTVEVAGDYVDSSEEIGGFAINAAYQPTEIDQDGYCAMTVGGAALLEGADFKTFFDQLPEGATFQVAPAAAQRNGDARDLQGLLASSLNPDGTFAWSAAPRTSFGDEGFLIKVVDGTKTTKAKIFVKIDDPLAAIPDEVWFPYRANFEVEYMSRTGYLECGVNSVDLAWICDLANEQVYMSGGNDSGTTNADFLLNFVMGTGDQFFQAYSELEVATDDGVVIWNEGRGTGLSVGAYGQKFLLPDNIGIGWYNRGMAIQWNDGEGTIPDYTFKWQDGTEFDKNAVQQYDRWWGNPNGRAILNIDNEAPGMVKALGLNIDNNGVIHTGELYTGFTMRFAIGIFFDYAYGVKRLSNGDQFMLLYFNRRRMPAEVTWPNPADYE